MLLDQQRITSSISRGDDCDSTSLTYTLSRTNRDPKMEEFFQKALSHCIDIGIKQPWILCAVNE
jgi:hypothetical protein